MSEKTENKVDLAKLDLAKKLDEQVLSVLKSDKLEGFAMAFKISSAIQAIKDMLTPEYMKPIMAMQNNALGFKTDKPDGGYPEHIVKNCLVEAVLRGVQPFNNHFNIIAGNCYITKEGFGYLLDNVKGLQKEINFALPRVNDQKTGAAIVMKLKWEYQGKKEERDIDFPIRMNQYMGTDAVIGKGMRKARKWLYDYLSGFETPDGDVADIDSTVVESKKNLGEKVKNIYDDPKNTTTDTSKQNKDLFDDKKK